MSADLTVWREQRRVYLRLALALFAVLPGSNQRPIFVDQVAKRLRKCARAIRRAGERLPLDDGDVYIWIVRRVRGCAYGRGTGF